MHLFHHRATSAAVCEEIRPKLFTAADYNGVLDTFSQPCSIQHSAGVKGPLLALGQHDEKSYETTGQQRRPGQHVLPEVRMSKLNEHERTVIVIIDEIYVAKRVEYSGVMYKA